MNKTSGEGFAAAGNKLDPVHRRDHRDRQRRQTGCGPGRWRASFRCAGPGPDFAADNDDPLTEELEIAHHGFRSSNASG